MIYFEKSNSGWMAGGQLENHLNIHVAGSVQVNSNMDEFE